MFHQVDVKYEHDYHCSEKLSVDTKWPYGDPTVPEWWYGINTTVIPQKIR